MAEERELIRLNLQTFAEGEGGAEGSTDTGEAESKSADERIAELEKQIAEKNSAIAEAEKKYGKLKSTMDVKLKELGDEYHHLGSWKRLAPAEPAVYH